MGKISKFDPPKRWKGWGISDKVLYLKCEYVNIFLYINHTSGNGEKANGIQSR